MKSETGSVLFYCSYTWIFATLLGGGGGGGVMLTVPLGAKFE